MTLFLNNTINPPIILYFYTTNNTVLKTTNCTFQEVDNIFCLAVGIAVYDEFFSCMCAAECLCAFDASVIYPASFVSTGQPYKNTQNCVKSSKNHPSWPSGNPKV
jgi:hypothetical protein